MNCCTILADSGLEGQSYNPIILIGGKRCFESAKFALVERRESQGKQGDNKTSPLRRRPALVSFSHVAQASTSTSFRGLGDFAIRSVGVDGYKAKAPSYLSLHAKV